MMVMIFIKRLVEKSEYIMDLSNNVYMSIGWNIMACTKNTLPSFAQNLGHKLKKNEEN